MTFTSCTIPVTRELTGITLSSLEPTLPVNVIALISWVLMTVSILSVCITVSGITYLSLSLAGFFSCVSQAWKKKADATKSKQKNRLPLLKIFCILIRLIVVMGVFGN